VGHTGGVSDCCWGCDDKFVISVADDGLIFLWSAEKGVCVRKYSGHQCSVLCCTFNMPGNLIATGSSDESVKIWETRSGKCLVTMPAHSDPVNSVSFSTDNMLLLTSSFENMLRLWDVYSGACLKTISFQFDLPSSIFAQFSPGGNFVLFALQGREYAYNYSKEMLYFSGESHEVEQNYHSYISKLQSFLPSGFLLDISNIFERTLDVKSKAENKLQEILGSERDDKCDEEICVKVKLACTVTSQWLLTSNHNLGSFGIKIYKRNY
jgi:WD40 repeat protein